MFGLNLKAASIGLAALAFGGTLSLATAPAQAQNYFEGYEYGPGRPLGLVGSYRNALGPQVYAPARGPVYYARPGFRGGYAYRGARYGYRGARYGYRGVGYYGPRYRYGYYGPRYGYGYPYYRRSNGGAVAAGLIGGLALGAIAANAARPVYYQRPVYADCWVERRRAYTRRGNVVIRRVRVCN